MSRQTRFPFLLLTLAIFPFVFTSVQMFGQSAGSQAEPQGQASPSQGENMSTPRSNRDSTIEFVPFRGLLAAAEQGSTVESSIEIVNRGAEPLQIAGIENQSKRFAARIETVESGQRYRLTVTFEAKAAEGKAAELVYLKTNRGRISVPVHTATRPSVYTFPKSVFLGRYGISEIKGNSQDARARAQVLMVYRKGTTGFKIKVTSDIPYLKIESQQGPQGDRWENTIWVDPERAEPGEINGTILIETNDPKFPKLSVPVTGKLLPD